MAKYKITLEDAMTTEEIDEAFQFAPAHPLWRAVMLVAAEFRETCVQISTDPELSERESNMALGGVAVMDNWIAELYDRARLQAEKVAKLELALKQQEAREAELERRREEEESEKGEGAGAAPAPDQEDKKEEGGGAAPALDQNDESGNLGEKVGDHDDT